MAETRLFLKAWRKQRRLTQKELGRLAGIGETHDQLVRGRPERRVHIGVFGQSWRPCRLACRRERAVCPPKAAKA